MELYWSPEPELMVDVTNEKGVDKAQCYYHALDVEKLEAELAQAKVYLRTVCEGWNLYVDMNGATRNNEAWGIVRRILTQKEEEK